jgi:hypothetical protein
MKKFLFVLLVVLLALGCKPKTPNGGSGNSGSGGGPTVVTQVNINEAFPDQIFRDKVIEALGSDKIDSNNMVKLADLATVTVIDLATIRYENMDGLQYLTGLTELQRLNDSPYLVELNVSKCTNLRIIDAGSSNIIKIIVNKQQGDNKPTSWYLPPNVWEKRVVVD